MIDLVVLLLLTAAVIGGWRQGLITSVLSATGWLGGVALGVWATPRVMEAFDAQPESELNTAMVVLVSALVLGVIGASSLGRLGVTASRMIPFEPARVLDATLGAIAMAVVTLLACWAAMSSSRPLLSAEATAQVDKSYSWRALDSSVPDSTRSAVTALNERFAESPFPEAFSGAEPQVEVEAPDGSAAASSAVQRAGASVVKVRSRSDQCEGISVGSGWVVEDDRIVTNAHVVAGGTEVSVQPGGEGSRLAATVVAFDAELDLAILSVPGLTAPPLARVDDVERGASVAAAGFPGGGDYAVADGRVRTKVTATGQDVYGQDSVEREIYLVRTAISPGNSGGPLLTKEGLVAGTIFAKSARNSSTGYALTEGGTEAWLDRASALTAPVSTRGCVERPEDTPAA